MNSRIVFAGGGTAGHVEPALAVAREWLRQHPGDECIFLGTSQGLETTLIPESGFALSLIPKVAMPRKLNMDLVSFPFRFASSIRSARSVIAGAKAVVGFGGYVSASAYLAARMERVPIVIHDANAKIGWANRFGSLFTEYLATTHPVSQGKFSDALITGVPLKDDIQESFNSAQKDWAHARENAKASWGWSPDSKAIIVMGGSQGSVALNNVIAQCMSELTSRGVQILHSVGKLNTLPESKPGYVAVPYISDMSRAYLGADLIIARSGAVTVAEMGALGRYALFIPLPTGNGEQALNAKELIKDGRATLVDQENFTAPWLVANVDSLLAKSMATSVAGSDSDIHAASKIVALMEHAMAQKVATR